MVDFAVVPARTALITVDLQTFFVAGYPTSAPDGLAILQVLARGRFSAAFSAAC